MSTSKMSISELNVKFQKACNNLLQINMLIDSTQIRYDRANAVNHRSMRYNLRLRLCVIEGVRNMFYENALQMAEQLDMLRREAGMTVVEYITDEE